MQVILPLQTLSYFSGTLLFNLKYKNHVTSKI